MTDEDTTNPAEPLRPGQGQRYLTMDRQMLRILIELDAIVVARLFGARPWLIDSESGPPLFRMIAQMGLEARVPGEKDTWRATPLGEQVRLDLIMVFLGLFDQWDMVYFLEEYGLIDKSDSLELYVQLEAGIDPESLLRGPVQRAYFDYYHLSKFRQ